MKLEIKVECVENERAHNLYYKLHKALEISITAPIQPNGDSLSVHTNSIVCYLAKSIQSGETWYDPFVDSWCYYFIDHYENVKNKQQERGKNNAL